jgi:hypothetical protein
MIINMHSRSIISNISHILNNKLPKKKLKDFIKKKNNFKKSIFFILFYLISSIYSFELVFSILEIGIWSLYSGLK